MDKNRHAQADKLRGQIKICADGMLDCEPKNPNASQPNNGESYHLVRVPVEKLPEVKMLLETAKKGYESAYVAL
jgi:hypothetical protein